MALQKNHVELEQYNKMWPVLYKLEQSTLKACLVDDMYVINHIGSTAIKNILAKPIIDILIGVDSLVTAKKMISRIEACGYEYKAEDIVPNRLFFTKNEGFDDQIYLHIAEVETNYYKDKLLFRNYLNKNKYAAKEYNGLKEKLASKYPKDRTAYTQAKMEFIVKTIKDAKRNM